MLASLFATAISVVSCLCIGQANTLGAVRVGRTSLLGYEVAGTIWEAQDAARALAYEAGKASAAEPRAAPALPRELLKPPFRIMGGRVVEVWRGSPDDPAVRRRLDALRGSVVGPHVTEAWQKGQGLGRSSTTEITYPFGYAVPAIEAVS